MTYAAQLTSTPDGRQLEVSSVGDPSGYPVLFHHGTPGSATLVKLFAPIAEERGYHFISTSRAGYGDSDRKANRAIGDVVSDATCALDLFGVPQYLAVGWSGGGPHALACAALDSPRCRAAVSIAGVAPYSETFDWMAGMGPENIEELALALEGGPKYEAHIQEASESGRTMTAENVIERFGGLLSEVDKAALSAEFAREVLAEAMRHSGSVAHYGFLDDDQAFLKSWGFELEDIVAPTEIWYGDHDLMVPPTHGRFLLENVAIASSFYQPNEGHVSILTTNLETLFDHLDALRATA